MRTLKVLLLVTFLVFPAAAFAGEAVYYLFRHAEKTTESNDPGLTGEGKVRAWYFVEFFNDKGVTRIFSSDFKRTRETVVPLSKVTGIPIEIYDPRDLEGFAETLTGLEGVIVVAGHSNTRTGTDLAALGQENRADARERIRPALSSPP